VALIPIVPATDTATFAVDKGYAPSGVVATIVAKLQSDVKTIAVSKSVILKTQQVALTVSIVMI
jgi:hypothetical protein